MTSRLESSKTEMASAQEDCIQMSKTTTFYCDVDQNTSLWLCKCTGGAIAEKYGAFLKWLIAKALYFKQDYLIDPLVDTSDAKVNILFTEEEVDKITTIHDMIEFVNERNVEVKFHGALMETSPLSKRIHVVSPLAALGRLYISEKEGQLSLDQTAYDEAFIGHNQTNEYFCLNHAKWKSKVERKGCYHPHPYSVRISIPNEIFAEFSEFPTYPFRALDSCTEENDVCNPLFFKLNDRFIGHLEAYIKKESEQDQQVKVKKESPEVDLQKEREEEHPKFELVQKWLQVRESLLVSYMETRYPIETERQKCCGVIDGQTLAEMTTWQRCLLNSEYKMKQFQLEVMQIKQGTEVWKHMRRFSITGSACGSVLGHNGYRGGQPKEKVQAMFGFGTFDESFNVTPELMSATKESNMSYGREHEPDAARNFWDYICQSLTPEVADNLQLVDFGMYVGICQMDLDEMHSIFAYSPDGVLYNRYTKRAYLVEYKCRPSGKDYPRLPSSYFDQIQLGMTLLGLQGCFFVTWLGEGQIDVNFVPYCQDYCQRFIVKASQELTLSILNMPDQEREDGFHIDNLKSFIGDDLSNEASNDNSNEASKDISNEMPSYFAQKSANRFSMTCAPPTYVSKRRWTPISEASKMAWEESKRRKLEIASSTSLATAENLDCF